MLPIINNLKPALTFPASIYKQIPIGFLEILGIENFLQNQWLWSHSLINSRENGTHDTHDGSLSIDIILYIVGSQMAEIETS